MRPLASNLLALGLLAATPAPAASTPNVLFIAVDDLRPELATYGADLQTPNFDRLAASGMRFDRAYCQQAVCGASRISIMGGLYPTRTKEQTFHVDGWRERHPDLLTMNQHFGAEGYRTIGLGKIYHGTSGPGVDPDNWTRWIRLGAPEYALAENNAAREAPGQKHATGNPHAPTRGSSTECAEVEDDFYTDGKRAAKAAEILRTIGSQNRPAPFFFALGFTKPHLPFVAPKKYWDLYRREDFEMPPNASIPPGYPEYAANLNPGELKKYADYEGEKPADFSDAFNRRLLHGYAACVSYADANLGTVLDALKESGLAEDTIVVLWGDHGWKLGDHSSWCKHTNFECDTRVPLLVRAPGHPGGQSTDRLVELIDLYPTLCELAGIKTPPHCQGKSFARLLADPAAGHRDSAYSSYPARREIGHSIRFANYRYTEWHPAGSGEPTGKQVLTDLAADPGEESNAIADPAHATALEKAQAILARRIAEALRYP